MPPIGVCFTKFAPSRVTHDDDADDDDADDDDDDDDADGDMMMMHHARHPWQPR